MIKPLGVFHDVQFIQGVVLHEYKKGNSVQGGT